MSVAVLITLAPTLWLAAVSDVSSRADTTCIVRDGEVWCWGKHHSGPDRRGEHPVRVEGLPAGATRVATGADHACAIVAGGAWCWGLNSSGQLGNGKVTSDPEGGDHSPKLYERPAPVRGLETGVTAIATNLHHTCAIKDGGAWCWGSNVDGKLGDGTTTSSPVPVRVVGLDQGVSAISIGAFFSCAVVLGGVMCWGRSYEGQLGRTSRKAAPTPIAVQGLEAGVVTVTSGYYNSCAVRGGVVFCWGSELTQLVLGAGKGVKPRPVPGMSSVEQLAMDDERACATVSSGQLHCWSGGVTRSRALPRVTALSVRYAVVDGQLVGLTQ